MRHGLLYGLVEAHGGGIEDMEFLVSRMTELAH
jgi:hypothetical protein